MHAWIRKTWKRIRLGLARWRAVPGKNPGYWPVKAVMPWPDGKGTAVRPGDGRWVDSAVPEGRVGCPVCGAVIPVRWFAVWCENCRVDLW